MPIALPLQQQILAIQSRIDALAATAAPDDIVMLAKAVEAIAGQATILDVMAAGETKVAEVHTAIADVLDAVTLARQQALADIAVVSADSVQNIGAIAMDTPALHSAALLF